VRVDFEELRAFASPNRKAVMVTRRKDGGSQTSPVTAVMDPRGLVLVWSRATTAKAHNLSREPHAALCIVGDNFSGWMHVEGDVEIVRQPEVMPLLEEYYRLREGREHEDWDAYRSEMRSEQRVLFRIQPTRIVKPA